MVEKQVEAKIIDALEALQLENVAISGWWQSTSGVARGSEAADIPAAIAVRVNPRTYETFSICAAELAVDIAMTVRVDLCPTGAELAEYVGPVLDLFAAWNHNINHAFDNALTIDGVFLAAGCRCTAGAGPILDRTRGVWQITYALTMRGGIPIS